MLDFSRIHAFKQGQRGTFEELVCQLARFEEAPVDATFRRVEGSGGDGGVEAYWTMPDGRVVAYQAKFFLSSGEIDWGQVDESVKQALETHPGLRRYVVAFPCDLTNRSGAKRKGKPGWDRWAERVLVWKERASAAGNIDVEFAAWTASDLVASLSKPNAVGLQEFFFGEVCLSMGWFNDKLNEAILALDERFHPEDHVEVRAEKLFMAISRSREYRDELLEKLAAVSRVGVSAILLEGVELPTQQNKLNSLSETLAELDDVAEQIESDPQICWDTKQWLTSLNAVKSAIEDLKDFYWEYEDCRKGVREH